MFGSIRKIALALLCFPLLAVASGQGNVATDWSYVHKKLKAAGFKAKFITAMRKSYDPAEFTSVLELNTLLFLRKADYHSPQLSDQSVSDVRKFMQDNHATLQAAEKKYGVSPTVITSLIWMESRFGTNLGRFHVASVFLNLLQADRPEVLAHLKLEAAPRFTPKLTKKAAGDIVKKAKTKAKWAIAELKAIEKMYAQDKELVNGLKGSFAGAFGMPQFIPSSYVHYARAAKGKHAPDLTHPEDAIHSVAHYLKESGWRKSKAASHEKALMRYNNSRDYARAILKLAERASETGKRLPAGKPEKKKRPAKPV
ncbi:MAG: lytic murein transglycosylase [Bdellovibrionales bacterium]|nr:lytic murein transglycosylase [Bdellovibrionales bacterium]